MSISQVTIRAIGKDTALPRSPLAPGTWYLSPETYQIIEPMR